MLSSAPPTFPLLKLQKAIKNGSSSSGQYVSGLYGTRKPSSRSILDTSVLQTLLKTNRPATDEERTIIQESIAPATAELETVKEQISESMARIQALKSQLEQAEIGLERLHEKEAAILESTAYHRGVLSSFRDFPEDVLREICLEFVEANISLLDFPHFRYGPTLAPYKLMQICRGIRRIVLETPSIWACINLQINSSHRADEAEFTTFISRARKWLQRAGRLALSIVVLDFAYELDSEEDVQFNQASMLIDFLLTYSPRWKSVYFKSQGNPTLITYIAALSTVNVPQLQSVSLQFQHDDSIFSNSTLLAVPTLEHLKLETSSIRMSDFTVNWEILTSLTLNGYCCGSGHDLSARDISLVLQKTKCLTFCNISVDYDQGLTLGVDYPPEINLPFLKILYLNDQLRSSESFSILDLINAPILQTFKLRGEISKASISKFFKRSPNIQEIFIHHFFDEELLMLLPELLRLCPSLIVLSLTQNKKFRNQRPLEVDRFFQILVQEDDVVTYSRLEYFTFEGRINVSLQTLREFLEGKQRGIATRSSLRPWKGVTLDVIGIFDPHVRKQMLDMFSRLNVRVVEHSIFDW